jgi:hypothetical protein
MIRSSSVGFAVPAARASLLLAMALRFGTAHAVPESAGPSSVERQQIRALQQQLAAVQARMQELAEQNRTLLRKELELERQMAQQSAAASAVAAAPAGPSTAASALPMSAAPAGAPVPPPAPPPTAAFSNVRLWGYGELYYTHPTREPDRVQADLARAVFGIGYSFDDRTEFNSEFEVEHAVASSSDVGEFEVEQFYVDRRLNDAVTVRAGLFLMPFGLLNEHHEPTNFYGVQRNFVETLIIPSTWREGGFNLHGDSATGIGWNVGLTTGFDLSKWNFTPQFPQYSTALDLEDSDSAPLQASHQELALANARNVSRYVALGYYGVPGVSVGAAISSGNAVQATVPNGAAPGAERVTLWEAHARWTPGKFDLSALYAHGSIGNTGAANVTYPGSANPLPAEFNGYFVQAAYGVWEYGDYRLAPFVRFERYDLGARYAGSAGPVVPAGPVPLSATRGDYGYWPQNQDRVRTVGANFYTTPHVVFKADYQWFDLNADFNRFDLGLGLNF